LSEYVETYCGCAINRTSRPDGSYIYSSPCTATSRYTIGEVKTDIENAGYCGEPEPEPEPEPGKVFVETYRGVDIYYDDSVHRYWFEFEGTPYSPATLDEAHTAIDSLLEPPPEPTEYWEYHSTYRDILIYVWMPNATHYQATFDGEIHNTTTLAALQAEIDAFLDAPYWEYHSTYRGIEIFVWMPDETSYQAYFGDEWHMAALLSTLQASIDAFLDVTEQVTIKIVTTESDPYGRYHGMTVDQSLNSDFWNTQTDTIFKTTGAGFTYTKTVEVAEGSHYIIYGNSASSSYPWYTKVYVDDVLIAEGNVTRYAQLRADFAVPLEVPPEAEASLSINVNKTQGYPGEIFMFSGLYLDGSGDPLPTGQVVTLFQDGVNVGQGTTDVDGQWLVTWTASNMGSFSFYAEAPIV